MATNVTVLFENNNNWNLFIVNLSGKHMQITNKDLFNLKKKKKKKKKTKFRSVK